MDQLLRLEKLIGKNNVETIKKLSVLVIGLGGVGGYSLESLVRSGIGRLIIVDYDTIDITNLNRQIITTHLNIGLKKTDEWSRRIKEINPNCEVIIKDKCLEISDIDNLINEVDYVIDACDTVSVKKEIIRVCLKKNIKFISSMGTGNKMDPTKLEIVDVRKTSYDPIAKIIRKMVKDERLKGKIMVVCSKESPKKINDNVISSNSFVPAIAGLLCTSYVINDMSGEL